MNILIGLAIWLVFFICVGSSFYLGYKQGCKIKKPLVDKAEEDLREKQKRKLMLEGMRNVMNYDYNKALGVKHE